MRGSRCPLFSVRGSSHTPWSCFLRLNDDEHGVQGTHATIFPDGCGLGSTWSVETLQQVGLAVGMEARGGHNGFVHSGDRGHNENGHGITMVRAAIPIFRWA